MHNAMRHPTSSIRERPVFGKEKTIPVTLLLIVDEPASNMNTDMILALQVTSVTNRYQPGGSVGQFTRSPAIEHIRETKGTVNMCHERLGSIRIVIP